jgi:predicted transcriptional regulator
MNKKSPDLLFIEKCFSAIKEKKDVIESTDAIKRTLKRMFDLNIDITLVNNTTNNFFGMVIYPSISSMDKVLDAIVKEKTTTDRILELWAENKEWYLEIDSILLYDRHLNCNPAELTAVMLHEIGHVIYSNTIPQRVTKIIRSELVSLTYSMKELCKKSIVSKLFELCIIEACSSKDYTFHSTHNEVDADRFVMKMGYGQELDNFVGKLLATQGFKDINNDDGELDANVKIMSRWAVDNITEIQMRKTKLKHSLDIEMLRTPSVFIKDAMQKIKDIFVKKEGSAYKQALSEQTLLKTHTKIVTESILDFVDNIGKIKKIQQVDIDIIAVQIEKMENQDDKIYLLDLIYDKIELVHTALDMIEKGKTDKVSQSKVTLLGFQTQLEKMRNQILTTKVKEKQYGVFIKYPAGYEG